MRQRDLIPFFAMAFLISWGILALYIFVPAPMGRWFGNLTGEHPLFYLAVYAPAIAAVLLVLYRHGIDGTRRFLARLLLWRASIYWYVFLIVGVPLVFYAAALFKDGTLSLGGATRLSGMAMQAFLHYLAELGIDVVRPDETTSHETSDLGQWLASYSPMRAR